jgi:Guanine nucleotide exchange factor in Golgi transport N-terminal/Sec7 domain/Dimerisation and cyclophilin-binding domain of Mon2
MTEQHGSVQSEALNGDTLDIVHPDGSIISDSSLIDKSLLNAESANIDISTQRNTEFVRVDDDESIPVVAGNERKTGSISGMKRISENVDDTNLIPLSRSDKSSTRSAVRNKSTRKSTTSRRRTKEEFHMMSDFEVNNVTETSLGIPPSRISVISDETPIPNSDASLRLLRKFANKTRAHIPQDYGGTKPKSILRYLFGTSSQENKVSLTPYSDLMMIILPQAEGLASYEESDIVVESVLGGSGDSMEKARLAVASFCHLLSVWCHASQSLEGKDPKSVELLAFAMDTATSIVAHGCLDDVDLILSRHRLPAVQIMVESVIVTDLSKERAELASLKFLLTTGCRNTSKGESLLKGQHLLQAIRVLYHIFLTTESEANKTTARASLQQLVTNVFRRMSTSKGSDLSEGFPSNNHRDAFLVLRSLCKLSMRNLPESGHSGLSITGSSAAWDGGVQESSTPAKHNVDGLSHDKIQTVTVHPIHPALESKILALDLLLYVLQNTDMSGNFLRHSGPQFQYAIRNYLCVSLLKNCMSENTTVVNLSLRLFVPIIRNFRSHLKTEIEAFVTNVFFVILDSKHSTLEHKNLVVVLFEEICSDPQTLAEIFLNYDCDLSAVDLFHRIVNTLSRVAKNGIQDEGTISSMSFVAGAGAARMERLRIESRELRLEAMRALRHVLASLHASIVEPMKHGKSIPVSEESNTSETPEKKANGEDERTLVEIYDSKKKRRAEESEAILRFNQKPSSGIKYAHQCGHMDGNDPMEVAKYLLKNKDFFDKTQIGEFLGREPAYQNGFALKVLHEYANMFDFEGLVFDDAIKYFLSGFRLPGEAQKVCH